MVKPLVSRLSLFDILAKVIPASAFGAVLFAVAPAREPVLNLAVDPPLLVVGLVPLTYVVGVVIQDASSLCFPRTKHFQSWMRTERENLSVERRDGEVLVDGEDHLNAVVLADAVVRFDLNERLLEPSRSSYDEKPLRRTLLFWLVCSLPLTVLDRLGLKRTRADRVYYGRENDVFTVLRQHAVQNGYEDYLRFQRLFVVHRSLSLVFAVGATLFTVSLLLAVTGVYLPVAKGWLTVVLGVFSLAALAVCYNGMLKYAKIRDERLVSGYYEDKAGDRLASHTYSAAA
jgi:hypothetical protein